MLPKLTTKTLAVQELLPATGKACEVVQVGGPFLVAGDQTITRVVDRNTHEVIGTEHGVWLPSLLSLSPKGRYLAIGEEQESAELFRVTEDGIESLDIEASHDGVVGVIAFDSGHLLVWYANHNEEAQLTIYDEDAEPVREVRTTCDEAARGPTVSTFIASFDYRHEDDVKPLVEQRGSYVLLGNVRDEDTDVTLLVPGSQQTGELSLIAAGKQRIAGLTDDGSLHLWSKAGKLLESFPQAFGPTNGPSSHRLCVAPSKPLVAIADDTARVTLIRDGERIRLPSDGPMGNLAFSEEHLVVAHGPHLDMWTYDLEHVGRATCPAQITSVAISGPQVYAGDATGAVHVTGTAAPERRATKPSASKKRASTSKKPASTKRDALIDEADKATTEGILLLEKGDPTSALERFQRAATILLELFKPVKGPDNGEMSPATGLTNVAIAAQRAKRWNDMFLAARQLSNFDRTGFSTPLFAMALRNMGHRERAKDSLDGAIKRYPTQSALFHERARWFVTGRKKQFDAAFEDVKKAVAHGATRKDLEADSELAALHADPRWAAIFSKSPI
jgi:hypothetical protein